MSDSIEILDSTELLACMCYFKIMFVLDTTKDVGNEEVELILIRFVILIPYIFSQLSDPPLFVSRCFMFTSKYLKKERINKRLIVQVLQDFVTISDEQVIIVP
jgi:hypothetical protein